MTSSAPAPPRLQTRDLGLGYRGALFAGGIDLDVQAGEIVAILGPSGSGKSTLLATIAGVVPALGGRVLVDGTDVTDLPIHRRGVGLIFQEPLLFPHLSVQDNVAYGLRRHGATRSTARARASDLLAWVGLSGYEERPVEQLSGGQAQRVATNPAGVNEPERSKFFLCIHVTTSLRRDTVVSASPKLSGPFSGLASARRPTVNTRTPALSRQAGRPLRVHSSGSSWILMLAMSFLK